MPTRLPFVYDDGGRAAAGHEKRAPGDCAARAVAIATDLTYQEAQDAIRRLQLERARIRRSDPDRGVYFCLMRWLLEGELGWEWRNPFEIAGRFIVRLTPGDLPSEGPLICAMRGHFAAVVDGQLRDTHDCGRGGRRWIYGYWRPPS